MGQININSQRGIDEVFGRRRRWSSSRSIARTYAQAFDEPRGSA
jgi:hypothetical protein